MEEEEEEENDKQEKGSEGRRRRKKKKKYKGGKLWMRSISNVAGVMRILDIYKKATFRYKGDLDLWFRYLERRHGRMKQRIASHIIKVHASGAVGSNNMEASEGENWLKRYIEYCHVNCQPRLSEKAAEMLQSKYVEIRQRMRQQSHESGRASAVPITVRQLEA